MEQCKGLIASGSILRHERPPILSFLKSITFLQKRGNPNIFVSRKYRSMPGVQGRDYRIEEHRDIPHIIGCSHFLGKK
jgi:hypothetical protein